jgi:hypothetical protein
MVLKPARRASASPRRGRAYEMVGGMDDVEWYCTEEEPCPGE